MNFSRKTLSRALLVAVAPLFLAACGVNAIPTKEEAAKSQWAEVQNQYQRRADLIPNLVETVKGPGAQCPDRGHPGARLGHPGQG